MPEDPSCSSSISLPGFNIFWVRPHQISQWSFMWDLLFPIKQSHLIKGRKIRWHASMNTKHSSINNSPQGDKIKSFIKILPTVRIPILFIYLIQKPIHHSDISTFMVTSQQDQPIWVPNFQAKQQADSFHRIITSINEISNHDELVVRNTSTNPKHLFHIIKLPMYITCNLHRSINGNDVGLLDEDIFYHVTQTTNCWFRDRFALP